MRGGILATDLVTAAWFAPELSNVVCLQPVPAASPETSVPDAATATPGENVPDQPAAPVLDPKAKGFDPVRQLKLKPADELWPEFFETPREGQQIRLIIQRLSRQNEHKHVIAALRAAIFSGQPEPWMYEVLALTMEIEGYPKKEVERVLLSMTDFNAGDVPNLLGSAAYLVRMQALAPALRLYRQVSQLEPTRPEPYLLGMRLADQLKEVDSVIWGATGVLTYVWYDGHEKQHQAAIKLLRDWQLRAEKAGDSAQAERIEVALREALRRDLHLKLVWSGEADLDLIIHEPLGTICSPANRYSQGGGALLHDGAGPRQEDCYEEYVCAYAAAGHYTVVVSHSAGRIVGNRARLEVTRYQGTEFEQTEKINVLFDEREKKYRISLHRGRRTEKTPVFEPLQETSAMKRQRTQQTLAQLRREVAAGRALHPQLMNNPVGTAGVGYSPVVTTINSGASLSAQAVVSADRRYVRIGLQPVFTQVTDVFTFTFASP